MARLSAQPDWVTCMRAPPISSSVVISPTTISAIRGEPRYIERVALDHEDDVAERRDVGAAGRRRPEQAADLRHLARQPDLVVEDPPGTAAAREQLHLIGEAGAGRVDEPDDRDLLGERRLGGARPSSRPCGRPTSRPSPSGRWPRRSPAARRSCRARSPRRRPAANRRRRSPTGRWRAGRPRRTMPASTQQRRCARGR